MPKEQVIEAAALAGLASLSMEDLPAGGRQTRWVAKRKAQVVAAVERHLLSLEEALRRYELSLEEFFEWQLALHRSGVKGLRAIAGKTRRRSV